mmetsp:Transcript_2077/g.5227  ORF Transcript_2077/g.5227 Transcript_2077/m.5227 type:complete len:205 (-) Transcript_2077:1157-1771(-)
MRVGQELGRHVGRRLGVRGHLWGRWQALRRHPRPDGRCGFRRPSAFWRHVRGRAFVGAGRGDRCLGRQNQARRGAGHLHGGWLQRQDHQCVHRQGRRLLGEGRGGHVQDRCREEGLRQQRDGPHLHDDRSPPRTECRHVARQASGRGWLEGGAHLERFAGPRCSHVLRVRPVAARQLPRKGRHFGPRRGLARHAGPRRRGRLWP